MEHGYDLIHIYACAQVCYNYRLRRESSPRPIAVHESALVALLVDVPSLSFDPVLKCDGILGTGGGVPANTGTLIGLPGDLAGAGIPVGGSAASAPPKEERLADRFNAEGVRDTLERNG